MNRRFKGNVIRKLAGATGTTKKKLNVDDDGNLTQWLHPAKQIRENYVVYYAKYLGNVEVLKPKGVEVVKEAIKKLKIARQVKKSEAGHKGSKLTKVEIQVSIDFVRILEVKSRTVVNTKPLHRVSYCADDHHDKRLFAYIAKDQETKQHHCHVLICEKDAAELTVTLGQAFQMAFRRYVENEKQDIKKTKAELNIGKRLEEEIKNKRIQIPKDPKDTTNIKEEADKNKDNEENSSFSDSMSFGSSDNNSEGMGMFFNNDDYNTTSNNNQLSGFQTLTNPLPTSPNNLSNHFASPNVLQNQDKERFSNDSWISSQQESFDFATEMSTQSLHGLNSNSEEPFEIKRVLSDDDFFVGFDTKQVINSGELNLNTTDTSISNNITFSDNNVNSSVDVSSTTINDFDDFTSLSSSPRAEDFNLKNDPFADVPDWNSVASEEISNPSKASSVCMDSFDTQPSSASLFKDNETFSSNGFDDLFTSTDVTKPDLSTKIPQQNDLFDNYLSNVVANREKPSVETIKPTDNPFANDSYSFGEINNNKNLDINASFDLNKSFDTNTTSTNNFNDFFSPNDSFANDSFDMNPFASNNMVVPSTNATSNNISVATPVNKPNKEISKLSLQDSLFANFDENNEVFGANTDKVNFDRSASSPASQTSRPRPSSLYVKQQGLPAPPTKKSIKAASITPVQSPNTSLPITKLKSNQSEEVKLNTNHELILSRDRQRSKSHILPNVVPINFGDAQVKRRSRVSGSFSVKPIQESIKNASKSLENLADIDSPPTMRSTTERLNRTEGDLFQLDDPVSPTIQTTPREYFKENFNTLETNNKITPTNFMKSRAYATFDESFTSS